MIGSDLLHDEIGRIYVKPYFTKYSYPSSRPPHVFGRLLPDPQVLLQSWWHCGMSSTEELPQAGDIEVEYDDLYRQDEEQAYVTLMSQEVASLNFAAEANYTVRLCKEIVHFHNPEEMPMGSFELIASNKVWLPPPALPAIYAER